MKHKTTPSIVTLSGVEVDLIDPDVMIIPVYDIAHVLSRTGRFGNHIQNFRSVAEHSLDAATLIRHVAANAEEKYSNLQISLLEKIAFCHEFAESLFGDMPSPLKYEPSLAGYKFLEKQMMKLFYMRFCGVSKQPEIVSQVDLMLLYWEAFHLNESVFLKIWNTNPHNQTFINESIETCNKFLGKPRCLPYEEVLTLFIEKCDDLNII